MHRQAIVVLHAVCQGGAERQIAAVAGTERGDRAGASQRPPAFSDFRETAKVRRHVPELDRSGREIDDFLREQPRLPVEHIDEPPALGILPGTESFQPIDHWRP
jgi:hypothetical protein